MNLEFFETEKTIVVNSDLDGVLSGLLLSNYLELEIAGFSNSLDKIWLNKDIQDNVFQGIHVDLYVSDPKVKCIDQHVIGANRDHNASISKYETKLNPNVIRSRTHTPLSAYTTKYPFGTVHFIIAFLERNNITLNINLNKRTEGITLMDLLLRADDTMKTTRSSPYQSNARDWWIWLYRYSNKGSMTTKLAQYLYSISPLEAEKITRNTSDFLMSHRDFQCDRPDGGFRDVCKTNLLTSNFKNFIEFLSNLSDTHLPKGINSEYSIYSGNNYRVNLDYADSELFITDNLINEQEVFSYAYVRSKHRDNCLSYTVLD